MKLSRRTLLIAASVSVVSVAIYRMFSNRKPEDLLVTVLPDFLDTLIPADLTPSASQLNVDEDIVDYLHDNPRYKNIVMFGCVWLNKKANELFSTDFYNLSLEEKTQVVEILEAMKENQTAQFFFNHIKDKSFEFYYSKPQSWVGLGIQHPPQPMGYSDYNQSPQIS